MRGLDLVQLAYSCDTESMSSQLPALIFDLDGTILDSKPGILSCLRKVLDARGVDVHGPLDRFIGPPVEDWATELLPDGSEEARAALARDYRIVDSEQAGQQRAEYGEALIRRLASDLTPRFGRGFGWRNLMQMRAFFVAWPSSKILQTPSAISIALPELATKFPLPWSAYVRLLSVKNPEARIFYEAEALRAGWSVRQLDRQISSLFYERIALSKNRAAMLEKAETAEPSFPHSQHLVHLIDFERESAFAE
jgi:hypothetical protein